MKSHESDQVELATRIYMDACAKCIAVNPDKRDIDTLISRIKDEGLSFLTITLPTFCRDFERSLADGHISSTFFQGFRKNGAIPAFLQGMLNLVFDRKSGGLLNEECSTGADDRSVIVGCVRQICRAFTKLNLDCSERRVRKAIRSFIDIEHDLNEADLSAADVDYFVNVSDHIWGNMFSDFSISELVPRHGPGATAEGVSGNQKYCWQYWHERLEPYFPFTENAYSVSVSGEEELERVSFISEEEEIPLKVTPVPKTQKGPRIIAIEPCCMQYAQQAVRRYLYRKIESSRLTRGHINFSDQSINKKMALVASKDGHFATLDLSEASDRVLNDLAIRMFDGSPDLKGAISSCRSSRAKLPDGTVIGPLKKFAAMGSALCFPVESMYFYTICIGTLLKEQNLPLTDRNINHVSRSVFVYGDDILVPSALAIAVCENLQKYHCKVNINKSFWTGKFRESCGCDAYDGEEVTPTYVRQLHPTNRRDSSRIVSFVKTANLFYKKGYWKTSSYMFSVCERYLGKLPYLADDSAGLGRTSFLGIRSASKWNKYLQRFEVKAWVTEPIRREDRIGGYAALQKSLLTLASSPKENPLEVSWRLNQFTGEIVESQNDLEVSVLRGAVALKRRWIAA